MPGKLVQRIIDILINIQSTTPEELPRIYEFITAVQNNKIVKSETPDGYVMYIFIEGKHDQ